jgi:hypothetical protein
MTMALGFQSKTVNPICGVKQDVFRHPRRLFFGKFVCFDSVQQHLEMLRKLPVSIPSPQC